MILPPQIHRTHLLETAIAQYQAVRAHYREQHACATYAWLLPAEALGEYVDTAPELMEDVDPAAAQAAEQARLQCWLRSVERACDTLVQR